MRHTESSKSIHLPGVLQLAELEPGEFERALEEVSGGDKEGMMVKQDDTDLFNHWLQLVTFNTTQMPTGNRSIKNIEPILSPVIPEDNPPEAPNTLEIAFEFETGILTVEGATVFLTRSQAIIFDKLLHQHKEYVSAEELYTQKDIKNPEKISMSTLVTLRKKLQTLNGLLLRGGSSNQLVITTRVNVGYKLEFKKRA